jgi:hypothetical protein
MVVAPEAIVKDIFGYRLKDKFSFTSALYFSFNICRVLSSTLMSRVAFEATAEFPMGSHDHRIVS